MSRRLVALVLLVVFAAGASALWLRDRLHVPYRGFAEAEVFVDLLPGSSVAAIADRLTALGIVADPLLFRVAARLTGADRQLQAGEYRFAEPASVLEVIDRLSRGDVYAHSVTFPEGRTIAEMAGIFGRSVLGTAEEFEAAASNLDLIAHLDTGADSLEGYLFPDTYHLPRTAGAEGLVRAMVARFEDAFDPQLRAAAAGQGLTMHEVVTLASLVEKETAEPSERATVAAVYRNRLRTGMLLQCDPTVIYALMLDGDWDGNLTRADLQMDSPYNTYRYGGLPPGPIAAPGRASMAAAIAPSDVPYLYFVSRNDGTHVFASTLAEHNRNVAEWQIRYFQQNR